MVTIIINLNTRAKLAQGLKKLNNIVIILTDSFDTVNSRHRANRRQRDSPSPQNQNYLFLCFSFESSQR